MNDPAFFRCKGPFSVSELAAAVSAVVLRSGPEALQIARVSTLDEAGPGSITFFDNKRYAEQLAVCNASAIVTHKRHVPDCPDAAAVLTVDDPVSAFGDITRLFYPEADKPLPFWSQDVEANIHVDETAHVETDVRIEPGALIGAGAVVGADTIIGAGACIGPGCTIGRGCSIGPGVSVQHALVGDRVILHPGVRIGQDGFGYASGRQGHKKIPQIGRVVVQDDVEIGANSCIDRGGLRDTVIGQGTKIDNLVQIAHNVQIGQHCMIVSGVSLAGSVVLGDFVAIGGHTVIDNHVRVGSGAQIAGISVVNRDVPSGERWGGTPAQPAKQWMRDLLSLRRLAQQEQAERTRGKEKDTGQ